MKLPAKTDEQTRALEIPNELKDVFNLADNMEGVIPRLPQIGIVHQAQLFKMPDEEKTDAFQGVILDQHPANAWWEKSITETGGGSIPDCFSLNGIKPEETSANLQSEFCKDCIQNQFGSDDRGKGKACKNMKRVMIIMEDSTLPRRLTIPPTSIKSFDIYMTSLVDRGLPYRAVVTNFALKKVSGEFEYSEINCTKERVLNKEELYAIAEYVKQYREAGRKQDIQAEEYINKEEDEAEDSPDSDIPF